jgi:amidase
LNALGSQFELQSATALLELLRTRRIGARELLDLLVLRAERLNPQLNAIVETNVEAARAAARVADDLAPGHGGPLHGLPMTLKDAFEVVGMTASCGVSALAQHRPDRDADAVARLRAAGAIPFGKTNVPTLAADHQSVNPVYGTTNNPWDITRTPGGSSGGAAAAVATGLTPVELGSDIGGSIRCPAHFCGIYGHKSSHGLVPLRGHIPPMPGSFVAPPLGVAGPMARDPRDLELLLDVLAAPEELERRAWQIRIPPARHERLRDFRVVLLTDDTGFSADAEMLQAIAGLAQELRGAGVAVDEQARPEIDWASSDDLYIALLFRVLSVDMPEPLLQLTEKAAHEFDQGPRGYPARIAQAMRFNYAQTHALLEEQQRLCREWARFFRGADIVLAPVMPVVAFPHDHSGSGPAHIAQYGRYHVVDGAKVPYLNGLQWPGLATIANLPATSIPTGRFVRGLPVGVQAIGPYLEDRTPIRFAQRVHELLGGLRAPPMALG